jgi:acetamidase/formamidase
MRNHAAPRCGAFVLAVALATLTDLSTGSAQSGRTHQLKATPTTVAWGYYDAAAKPVLTVDSGDTVEVETVLASALVMRLFGVEERWITDEMRQMDSVTDRGVGAHLLVGPIFVNGAEPGDVLEVRIKDVRLREPFAINVIFPGFGSLPQEFPASHLRMLPIDINRNFAPGIDIPLRPFFGSIGVAPPPMMGRISSNPPGIHTGNLDNKDLVAGSTLFIPVHVKGALLFIGDGHAAQGDGEVAGTAVECALGGTLQLVVRKDLHLNWARAETPTHFITMGLDPDLDEAAKMAIREMVAFLVERFKFTPVEAYMFSSMAVDLKVSQVVDGVKGIHAMVAKDLFKGR